MNCPFFRYDCGAFYDTLIPMTQHTQDTLYLLDSYGLIYRSYFAFVSHPLTNKAGENVSALYGFFRSLAMMLKTYRPQYFLAAFDSRTPTFRHEWYPEYKATRDKTPEDLHAQIPHIEKILTTLGIACLRKDGFEADDIIATLACRAAREGRRCVIISGDKDLAQLVGDFVSVLKPDKSEALAHCGIEEVKEHWGVAPAQMLDYLSLIGDASDNIPGVKGIGPKTAVKLLQDYGTLDAVYEHINSIAGAVQKKLAAGKESAYFSKKLITLAADIPIEGSIEDYRCDALHYTEAAALLKEYELPRLGELYTKSAEEAGTAGAAAAPNTVATGGSAGSSSAENGSGTGDAIARGKAASFAATGTKAVAGTGNGTTPAELRKNTGEYRTVTDAEELEAVIAAAEAQGFAAFDCETTGLNPLYDTLVGFSLSLKAGTGIYVPLKAPTPELGEQPFTVMPLATAKKLLARLWSNEALTDTAQRQIRLSGAADGKDIHPRRLPSLRYDDSIMAARTGQP